MALGAKAVAKNIDKKFSRNVVETEQHLLRHLLYDVALAHCTNGLVKLTK